MYDTPRQQNRSAISAIGASSKMVVLLEGVMGDAPSESAFSQVKVNDAAAS
jgi:hypothetical protein